MVVYQGREYGQCVPPSEDAIVVEPQTIRDQVEQKVQRLLGPDNAKCELVWVYIAKSGEASLPCDDSRHPRNSQSTLKRYPTSSHFSMSERSSFLAAGRSAEIRARAKSPLESLVPPELTRLKMSTTSSIVFSLPVISSIWSSRSRISTIRANRVW